MRNGAASEYQPVCILSISLQSYSGAFVLLGLEKDGGHQTTGCRLLSIEDDRGRFGMAKAEEVCLISIPR